MVKRSPGGKAKAKNRRKKSPASMKPAQTGRFVEHEGQRYYHQPDCGFARADGGILPLTSLADVLSATFGPAVDAAGEGNGG